MKSKPTPSPTVLCRAHLHHKWIAAYTPDGERYMRCKHCGTDRTEFDDNGFGGKALAASFAGFGGG